MPLVSKNNNDEDESLSSSNFVPVKKQIKKLYGNIIIKQLNRSRKMVSRFQIILILKNAIFYQK